VEELFVKALALLALALPLLAHAEEPRYKLPNGVQAKPETCVVTEMVRADANSDWGSETSTNTANVAFWTDGDGFASLRQNSYSVNYSRFTENVVDRTMRTRVKQVEDWKLVGSEWQKDFYTLNITIFEQRDQPGVRVVERRGDVDQIFDVKTWGEGNDFLSERSLRNPSVLSREGREVGSHVETCRSAIGFIL
jgi:hypothetical protein